MNQIARILTLSLAASSLLVACKKSDVVSTSVNNTSQTPDLSSIALIADPDKATRQFTPLDGGDKADCSDDGTTCFVKLVPTTDETDELEEMHENYVEDGVISPTYFTSSGWSTLFGELEEDELTEIADGNYHFYAVEDANSSDKFIYVLSTSATQAGISTTNTIGAWGF